VKATGGPGLWYGEQFHGRKTASGERFDSMDMTAAHKTLPFGTRVCVRGSVTGKSVVVRGLRDRGPFAPGRVIDLSKAAAQELGMLGLALGCVGCKWQLDVADEDSARPRSMLRTGAIRCGAGRCRLKTRAAFANQPARKVSQTAKRKR
jgi:rare lipoprotein A